MTAGLTCLKPSQRLDKLCRFLNSVKGTDKVFMVQYPQVRKTCHHAYSVELVQYLSKIINWYLLKRNVNPSLVKSLANLAGPVSDFRVLLRYYGLLPMWQWIVYSETNPDPNPKVRKLIRLENFFNVCYYPLEHLWWLSFHKIINISDTKRDAIGLWSCRFWAAYVVTNFVHLYEDYKALERKKQRLSRDRILMPVNASPSEKKSLVDQKLALDAERRNFFLGLVTNVGYFPLTLHWSLVNSKFPDVGVGIFGTIACLSQMYSAWLTA